MSNTDYKVADIGLAGFGRKEIQLAEAEMPGQGYPNRAEIEGGGCEVLLHLVGRLAFLLDGRDERTPIYDGDVETLHGLLLAIQRYALCLLPASRPCEGLDLPA